MCLFKAPLQFSNVNYVKKGFIPVLVLPHSQNRVKTRDAQPPKKKKGLGDVGDKRKLQMQMLKLYIW